MMNTVIMIVGGLALVMLFVFGLFAVKIEGRFAARSFFITFALVVALFVLAFIK